MSGGYTGNLEQGWNKVVMTRVVQCGEFRLAANEAHRGGMYDYLLFVHGRSSGIILSSLKLVQ